MSNSKRALRRPTPLVLGLMTLLIAGGVWLYPLRESPAGLEKPPASDRQVALVVTWLLKQEHLLQHPLDDEISHRALDMFLKNLDPMKVYFYQSDVDEFMQERDHLDDLVQER